MALEGRPLVHPSKHVRPLAGFCLSARPAYWGLCSDCVRSACPSHSKKALTRKIKGERLTTRATESQGEGSPTLAELESRLKEVLAIEDYVQAALIRDQIRDLDPALVLKRRLQEAILAEDYPLAAQLRDELKAVEAIKTESSAETENVCVRVRSHFEGVQEYNGEDYFYFSYRISITNNGPDIIRLKTRHWEILDGNNQREIVEGVGVVGQNPELRPEETFTYQSMCPLRTPTGSMEGYYRFARLDPLLGHYESSYFTARIAQFALNANELDRRL